MVYCTIETPLGDMTASAEKEELTGLWFKGQKYYPTETASWVYEPDYAVFNQLREWLSRYFSGGPPITGPRLRPQGTPFQKAVWDALLEIPFGRTSTYGDIAKKLAADRGRPSMYAQAVGGAVGHNPISILIPCHRVVGSDGSLTGYAGGLDKKERLLSLERGGAAKVKTTP